MATSKTEFLKPAERRFKTSTVGGMTFRIQSLFASEMRALRKSMLDKKGELIPARGERLQELLIARCLVDDENARMLTDQEVLDGALDQQDGGVISALFADCKEFTGFGSDSDWDAIEGAAKNSERTNSNGSTKESPSGAATPA